MQVLQLLLKATLIVLVLSGCEIVYIKGDGNQISQGEDLKAEVEAEQSTSMHNKNTTVVGSNKDNSKTKDTHHGD